MLPPAFSMAALAEADTAHPVIVNFFATEPLPSILTSGMLPLFRELIPDDTSVSRARVIWECVLSCRGFPGTFYARRGPFVPCRRGRKSCRASLRDRLPRSACFYVFVLEYEIAWI